ncbi:MAG: hypothetical protein NVS1B10_02070 [Candidatus Saccharimonadales bacterium]
MAAQKSNTELIGLRQTLAWMALIMDNINESVFVVDDRWRLIYANDALLMTINSLRIQIIGRPIWEVLDLQNENIKIKETVQNRHIEISDSRLLNDRYNLDSNNTSRIFDLNCNYIAAIKQAACVLNDVTLEVRATQQLQDLNNK